MTSAAEASFYLDRQLLARLAAGRPAHIEQIDSVLAEDGVTVVSYIYLANTTDDDCIVISYDWQGRPQDFDRQRAAAALLCSDCATLH